MERAFNRPANRITEEVTFQMPSAIEKLSVYVDKNYKMSIKEPSAVKDYWGIVKENGVDAETSNRV